MANEYSSSFTGLHNDQYDDRLLILENQLSKLNIYTGTLLANNWGHYDVNSIPASTYSMYKNKWYCEFYSHALVDGNTLGDLNCLLPRTDLTPRHVVEHNATSGNQFSFHRYRCKATSYVWVPSETTVTWKWASDDEGAAWVNGKLLGTNTSCAWSSEYSIDLSAGYNEFCIIYHENGGGEWFTCSPALSSFSGAINTSVKIEGYTQTISITSPSGIVCNESTTLYGPFITSSNFVALNNFNHCQFATISSSADGEITVATTNMIKPDIDLQVYWLGYQQ